ncbi:MAG TPA: LAGLIDADG family homing endonuclease, partial [Acidimicrobiia bacterium]
MDEAVSKGLRVERQFTREGEDVYESVQWSRRDSRISNPDGSIVFEMKDAEVPEGWSQVAADIMVSKYFRKAGVPQLDERGNPTFDDDGKMLTGPEGSARQVIKRLAATWRSWGETSGYFASDRDADAFEDELAYMLLHQMAAPNSPQWFNTGLAHMYGIKGTPQGFWYVDPDTEELLPSPDSYTRPAPHACFPAGTTITTRDGIKAIEKIEIGDEVLTHNGRYRRVSDVMQRQVDESLVRLGITGRIAKALTATGNHPVLAVRAGMPTTATPEWVVAADIQPGDHVVAAGDPASGELPQAVDLVATTDRESFYGTVYNFQVEDDESYVANGIVVHNCFINSVDDDLVNEGGIMDLWVREARLFKMGSGTGSNFSKIRAEGEQLSGGGKSSGLMSFLKVGDRAAGAIKSGGTTRRAAKMVILDVDHPDIETFIRWKAEEEKKVRALVAAGYSSDFNGEAYATVSGQNSNNSVRLSNEFIDAVLNDQDWELTARTDGSVMKTVKARDLWRQVADAAWQCADPGVQFDTTIQEWHTSPAGGRINATNPCFTGETRIATDKGLIQFRDLVRRAAEGESFEVYSHDATHPDAPVESVSLSRPTQIMVTGTNEIVKLEFSDGRVIRTTPNHRLFTSNRGWVRADELTAEDRVRLLDRAVDFGMAAWSIPVSSEASWYQARSSRRYAVELPAKWSEDFAHYLGWLVGDGSMTGKMATTIYGSGEEQQTAMLAHAELLTAMNGGMAPKPAAMTNGTYQLRVSRGAIRKFLVSLGVTQAKSAHKRVPCSIFEAPKPIVAAFLQGLFDADGTVVHRGDKSRYAGLGSTSEDLLRDVQQLLDTFGIRGRIYRTRAGGTQGFEYTTKLGEDRTYESIPMHDLRVTSTSLERFAAAIGFTLPSKRDRLEQLMVEAKRYASKDWSTLVGRRFDGFETTYNLTEPINHSYVAGGALVSNCSEYVFLDNTACNLASLNLVTFYDAATGGYDLEAYRHAIRLWTIVLEISVTMAHFPSAAIAQGSYDYRTLGLGYANLGSLLMQMGIAYDSDEGRAIAGAMTAILTGHSYSTSAEMAGVVGPFPRYAENAESMLRVIRNHRRAALGKDDFEDVSHKVVAIDQQLCPPEMLHEAHNAWNTALKLGETYGYRNAQTSVLAPTGCLVGGSLVPTERGLVRLASLGDVNGSQWQDLGLDVATDEGSRTATKFYVNGVEPVVTVETSRGYRIQGTPTHRIRV